MSLIVDLLAPRIYLSGEVSKDTTINHCIFTYEEATALRDSLTTALAKWDATYAHPAAERRVCKCAS